MRERSNDHAAGHGFASNMRRAGWFLFYTGNVIFVAAAVVGIRWWQVNQLPESAIPKIPQATLPRENGFTRLADVASRIVRSTDVGFALARKPNPNDPKHIYTPVERQRLVAENAAILAEARQALTLPSVAIPVRSFDQRLPELAKGRSLARLFALDGLAAEEQKEYGRAAGAYLDAMTLDSKVANGGSLIHKLVGIACQSIGRRPFVALADRLSAGEARQAASRLETIIAQPVTMASAFEEEKWGTQAGLVNVFRRQTIDQFVNDQIDAGERASSTLVGMMNGEAPEKTFGEQIQAQMRHIQIFFGSLGTTKAEVLQRHAAFMDELIARSKQPYHPGAVRLEEPKDPVNQLLFPVFEQAVHKDADTRAQNAMLLTKLALRAYRLEHHAYPESLEELVNAKILNRVPLDPFGPTLSTPLRYRRLQNDTYLLYSIGPDGKDDNGTPINNPSQDGKQRPFTNSDSKGDFVLGVNLF